MIGGPNVVRIRVTVEIAAIVEIVAIAAIVIWAET
jgi:hypothetical protein